MSDGERLLTAEDFRPCLDQTFEVSVGQTCLPMTLRAVEPLNGSSREGGGFRLEFEGPPAPVLAQAVMRVSGPDAAHDIFMVPIARDAGGARYEAIFY